MRQQNHLVGTMLVLPIEESIISRDDDENKMRIPRRGENNTENRKKRALSAFIILVSRRFHKEKEPKKGLHDDNY
jgi:hypothetical protein